MGSSPTPGTVVRRATELSVARGTVRCVVHVRPAALVRSALEQMRLGVPDEEIALHHGVALNTVRRWRRLHLDLDHPVELRREEVACPRCADTLDLLDGAAYAELLGWYPGTDTSQRDDVASTS